MVVANRCLAHLRTNQLQQCLEDVPDTQGVFGDLEGHLMGHNRCQVVVFRQIGDLHFFTLVVQR